MFFDDDDERQINPNILHVVRRELRALSSNLDATPYGLRSVPTHTEDGIPIRKLYVSNLPPKTTRHELFGVFAQYGFIKSCWLRMGDKGPNKTPTPTYAFVTYSNPADAHKALQAPNHEKILRGRNLRISPADSWHQPAQDADGHVRWKPRPDGVTPSANPLDELENSVPDPTEGSTHNNEEAPVNSSEPEVSSESQRVDDSIEELTVTVLQVLNRDCWNHILSYVPLTDLIRSERVSKGWQSMVQEYLQGIRIFKTSWWQHTPVTLTTAVLRRVLQRVGGSLWRLHIDHHWSALNDRTAHTVGKFCPNLEELKVVGMYTKNWNPLIYGCKQLKNLSFVSCNKLTDSSLVHLVKSDSCIESLTVANNTHVTGLFLTGSNPPELSALSFYNCYSLQGTVLSAAIDTLPRLTTLRLDVCPVTMWKIIPLILRKLPGLEELSLSEYTSVDYQSPQGSEEFCEAIGTLAKLKRLNLSRNIYITNAVLKQVAQCCPDLEALNISSCNSKKSGWHPGVGDEGVTAICASCKSLASLDVSYLAALNDAGLAAAARLPQLARLTARGNPLLSGAPLAACLDGCPLLEEVDVCGCENVGEEAVIAAVRALQRRPRPLLLRVAATPAATTQQFRGWQELPRHKLLLLNAHEDLSNPHLRPDFVDHVFDDSSDDSFDDLYDHGDLEDFLADEDEMYLEEADLDDYEGLYYGLRSPDIFIL